MTDPQNADIESVTQEIAAKLGETEQGPVRQVRMIVQNAGVQFAREVLALTMEIEGSGGMLTADGSRRRTAGGTYFYVAKGRLEPDLRQIIFPNYTKAKRGPVIDWAQRAEILSEALSSGERGYLTMAPRITLQGRVKQVHQFDTSCVVLMEHKLEPVAYGRGIPTPSSEPTLYIVFMGREQYDRVARTLRKNAKDSLLVEGACMIDPALGGISVLAVTVSTRFLQKKQREHHSPAIGGEDESAAVVLPGKPNVMPNPRRAKQEQRQVYQSIKASRTAAAARAEKKAAAAAAAGHPVPSASSEKAALPEKAAPPAARKPAAKPSPAPTPPAEASSAPAQQLRELEMAATTLRERIVAMEAKKQPGIAMTRKILENTERQIEALRKELQP